MSSASEIPLEDYLSDWNTFARLQLFNLIMFVAAGYVVMRLYLVRRRGAEKPVEEATPPITAPVLLGLWFGLLSGFGEGLYVALRTGLLHKLVWNFLEANLVTALLGPIMNALLFGALGALVMLLVGRRSPARAVWFATALFTLLTVAGWALVPSRIDLLPGLLLAVGAAVQAGRMVTGRTDLFARYVRTSVTRGVALFAGVAMLSWVVPKAYAHWLNTRVDADSSRPNVLWIVIDTERAKSLELYGRERVTSPFFTRFAEGGIGFDHALAPARWTLPSHASMFTGLRARELGIWDWAALEPQQRTIAEVLREHGYETAGFAGNLIFLNPSIGLSQGFTNWSATVASPGAFFASTWIVRRVRRWFSKVRPDPGYMIERHADSINRGVRDWFDGRSKDRPYFVFINYFDVHEPFRGQPGTLRDLKVPDQMLWYRKGTEAEAYSSEELTAMRDAYESEIARLDGQLDGLLSWLSDRGHLDRTLVIITADHGEQFGEHGLLEHTNSLYRQVLHVPLAIRLPDGGAAGTRIAEPVALRNLGATILEIAAIGGTGFPGTSLSRCWTEPTLEPTPVYSSIEGGMSVVAEGYHLLVKPGGIEELYRLEDADETENLAPDPTYAGIVQQLRALLPEAQP